MRLLSLFSLLLLTACGFAPVYGTNNTNNGSRDSAATVLNQTRISAMKDREGQFLRNALIDRFYRDGYPTNPQYQLTITELVETETDFDITVESEATRRQLKIRTSITLGGINTNKPSLKRNLYAVSSYNVLESEFATRVSEQNAREAILNDLSRQIEQQIALHLSR